MTDTRPRVRVPAGRRDVTPKLTARPRPLSQYMNGEQSPFFHSWNPQLRSADIDVRQAYTMAAARAIDTIHNSGWISGAVDQAVASTIGQGLRLAVMPDVEALGWTVEEGQEWSRGVERRWEAYANRPDECDITGRMTVGKMTAAAFKTFFGYGEITAALPFVKRNGAQYGTKVQLVEPSRLSQASDDLRNIIQGVRCDATGYPLGYRIRQTQGMERGTEREIPARDGYGRPQFIHVHDGPAGAYRGLPLITPALKVVRQFDQLSDATLMAALIQAIFAATVQSPDPTEVTLQAFQDMAEQAAGNNSGAPPSGLEAMLQARAGWYEGTNIDLGSHGKIAHLAPGDKLEFLSSKHPNTTYEAFVKFLLREISRCLGITFEQLTGDYSGATYSSVRMATSEMWQVVLYRRINVIAPFLRPVFEAWLEEDIEQGWTKFPGGVEGFMRNRAAATRCHWRGPAKPQADDQKFAKAVETLMALGVVTMEWVCAEMGDDWEDVMEQIAREQAMRKKLGIPSPSFVKQTGGPESDAAPGAADIEPAEPAVEPEDVVED